MSRCHIHCHLNYKIISPTTFVFQIQAQPCASQQILAEHFEISPQIQWHEYQCLAHQNRHIRFQSQPCSSLDVYYTATIERDLRFRSLEHLNEVPISQLPDVVLPYLLPSLYCQSDELVEMAQRSFAWMPQGYVRVKAIEQWIYNQIMYQSGSSNHLSTARDILIQRAGVCRDFAHLGIALCRALGIPARIVVGYVKIEKFIPDFHAIFEAYLDGGWVRFDATRLAPVEHLVQIAVGRDASDVAFATFYGQVELLNISPVIHYDD